MNVVVSKFGLLWDDDHRGESGLRREISNVELDVASKYGCGVLCPASTLQRLTPCLAVDVVVYQGLKIFRTRLSTLNYLLHSVQVESEM